MLKKKKTSPWKKSDACVSRMKTCVDVYDLKRLLMMKTRILCDSLLLPSFLCCLFPWTAVFTVI
jgi:hypothetical protein